MRHAFGSAAGFLGRLFALLLPALLLVAGAAQAQGARGPLVLAAASLQESMTAAADAWAAKGNARPVLSFAASSALARQVEKGAPADLLVSADQDWMDWLEQRRLLRAGTRADFLGNRLVLVAPAKRPLAIRIGDGFALAAALGTGKLAMADPDSVPAGRYGQAALSSLGVWAAVAPKVVRTENVRAALLFVERDAARAGIVYETDARASRAVRVAGVFPANSHPPITYPLALVAASKHPQAEAFRRFLLSREGKAVFARYGFKPLNAR